MNLSIKIFSFLQKQIKLFVLSVIIIFSFQDILEAQSKPYRLIFSANLLQNFNLEDAVATTQVLANHIQKSLHIKEAIGIEVEQNLFELEKAIKQPFDFILATSVETKILSKYQKLEPILVNETDNEIGYVFYLVVKRSSNIKSLKELKNSSINILAKSQYHTAGVWIDKLLRDEHLPAKEKFFSKINYDYKANNVLLPVFFGKIEAAVILKNSFDLICDLNPQVRQDLIILKKSDPIISGIISFDGRSNDNNRKELMLDILSDLHKDNYGRQILDLFSVNKVVPYKDEYWQKFLDLYK